DVDAKVPVTWNHQFEHQPGIGTAGGMWHWRTPDQPHGRINLAGANRTGPLDRISLEHELTHALTARPDGMTPLYDLAQRVGGRPADSPAEEPYLRYMTSPVELDPRLAEIKRQWVHATGRQMETPDDAREAMEAAMRVMSGVQPSEIETHYGPQWQADLEWRTRQGLPWRLTPEDVKRLKRIHLLEQYYEPDHRWRLRNTTS